MDRRTFLKAMAAGAGVLAAGGPSCGGEGRGGADGKPFTFIQLCDPQLGMGGYEHDMKTFRMAVDQINGMRRKPDFVVVCGDLINGNHATVNKANSGDFARAFADYKRINDSFRMKSHSVPGNHDVGKYPNELGLRQYRDHIGRDYYSFEHNGYTFIIVNTLFWWSNVAGSVKKERPEHDEWFVERLKRAQKGKIFVAGHHPLFLDAPDEERRKVRWCVMSNKRDEALALFEEYGVVYLSGHRHANYINQYKKMPLVTIAATSRNIRHDRSKTTSPLGYCVWSVGRNGVLKHEYVAIKGAPPPEKGVRIG